MPEKRRRIIIALFVVLLLVGIGAILYPLISAYHNEKVSSKVFTQYQDVVTDDANRQEVEQVRLAAQSYNDKLFRGDIDKLDWMNNGYVDQMRLQNSDVMAYLRIPKIDVKLPVYHGTGESTLQRGIGHMESSSLPVGGLNTHAVLSAHTGMSTSKMFTDLELLEPGDVFYIDVLGETLAYEVMSEEDISVVLPSDISKIRIYHGEDLVTLITCTPYGVNTHRLLVTGHRITEEEAKHQEELAAQNPSQKTHRRSAWETAFAVSVLNGVILAALACIILTIIVLMVKRHKRKVKKAKAALSAPVNDHSDPQSPCLDREGVDENG